MCEAQRACQRSTQALNSRRSTRRGGSWGGSSAAQARPHTLGYSLRLGNRTLLPRRQ